MTEIEPGDKIIFDKYATNLNPYAKSLLQHGKLYTADRVLKGASKVIVSVKEVPCAVFRAENFIKPSVRG